uniref:Dynein heavy chain 3, axonemal n=1 Tax=Laticauda laticaudata TaxID=8630 RepID=A0A8C5RLG6_LATLA
MNPKDITKILRSQTDSIYNMSHAKQIPELPPLPSIAVSDPSQLYQMIQESSHYPTLMQRASWMLAVPLKEQCHFRMPSNSIANNYTLTARNLKMKDLQKLASPVRIRKASGSTKQKAEYPPAKEYAPSEKKMKMYVKNIEGEYERAGTVSQVCSLDLLRLEVQIMEDGVPRYSDSQPLTPEEQFVVMCQHEEEMNKGQQAPTEEDLERYCYYIHKGIRKDMLAPQDENVLNNILTRIPSNFLASPELETLLNSLMGEIQSDYQIWLMKNIVDYILMDPDEKKRLFICNIPQPFPQRVIRAPVPWHKIYQDTKLWNETHLFTVNPMMLTLQQLWFSEFSDLRFIRTKEILEGELPLLPSEFEELIRRQCQEAHEILQTRWIPRCADLFIEQKEKWLHLAPQNDLDSCQQIEEYFASVAILMSLQLREMVINSLEDLLNFFKIHKDGNDFGDVYQDMQFFIPQILVLKLDVEDPSIIFDPDVRSLWDLVCRCFIEILKHSEGLPKVQVKLFPELKGDDLTIRTVNEDEALVADYVQKTAEIFDLNLIGPQKYLNVYRKYNDLLNNNADKDVTEFLSKRHELEDFVEKIDGLTKLKKEIASLHITVPLALFCLDALKLNEELCNRIQRLKDRLIEFEVEENRNLNKRACSTIELGRNH